MPDTQLAPFAKSRSVIFTDDLAAGPNHATPPTPSLQDEIKQLRQENHRLAREMEYVRATAQVVANELDTAALSKALARQVALALNAERVLIGVNHDEVLHMLAQYCHGCNPNLDLQIKFGANIAGWVAQRRQAYVCNDVSTDVHIDPPYAQQMNCRNVLCVPILNHQGHVLGVIEIHNRRNGGFFNQDDIRAAKTLAIQSSIGFERAQLYTRMTEWAQSLEMLLAFNAAINEQLDPSLLIRRLVEHAARFLKAEGGMAGLAVPIGPNSELGMVSDAYWHAGKWHTRPQRWQKNQGLPGFMLESEFPFITNNYPNEKWADAALLKEFDIQRALCVPIKDSHDRVLGFFKLHKNANSQPFTWQDAAFLESLANTTAVAIQNAQLMRALEIKNEQIQNLSANHVMRLEDERRHISRELHDEAGQVLIGIKLGLQAMAQQIPPEQAEMRKELDTLRKQVNLSTAQLKELARRLRPPTLDELGLFVALKQLVSDYQDKMGNDLLVYLELNAPEQRLSQPMETALYRIVQEGLTNCAKYAQAQHIWVTVNADAQHVTLSISDDGKGFDLHAPHHGLGLLGMRERVEILDGQLVIDSRIGEGTHIEVTMPR
ncbi:MAG: GAF domain-containing sensor histidine kinase [Anaerolineae bacterium]|nr:GAF domain-containing sensor histidine kinase [Anaerolineae bacterium]